MVVWLVMAEIVVVVVTASFATGKVKVTTFVSVVDTSVVAVEAFRVVYALASA